MKTVISYVSGTGGDFIVNCCNHAWISKVTPAGAITASATIRHSEDQLGNTELLQEIERVPYNYVGGHNIDRLLKMKVKSLWLVVPDKSNFKTWVVRDAITKNTNLILGPYGTLCDSIVELVNAGKKHHAAEIFLDWLFDYNWTLMQMRLVQPTNKIDISELLIKNGIDSIIDQMPELEPVANQCRVYHRYWLSKQAPLTDTDWVVDHVANKLYEFVQGFLSRSQLSIHG